MRQAFFIILLTLLCSFQDTKYYRTKIDKHVSLLIPSEFVPVPPDELATKFISYRAPLAAYTNMTTEIEFGINTSVSRWRDTDIELMHLFYKSNIANLYDEVQFLRDEIQVVNNRQFVVFEFISKVNPEDRSVLDEEPLVKYTYIQYAILKGKVFIFDFTSPSDQQQIWHPVVQRIMESVKIK